MRCRRCLRRKESSYEPRGLPFDAPADLATELPQHFVAIALLNDALDAAIEAVADLIGQVLGGDDHYWDFLAVGPSAQRVEELEPIHPWHHQVENDHIRPRGCQHGDRFLAVPRLRHPPSDRLQRLADTAADHLVVVDQKGVPPGRTADAI